MKRIFASLLALTFAICAIAQDQEDTSKYKPVVTPEGFTSQLNVVYATANGWEGKMDLYLPPNEGKTTPVVINIHGGGWNHGTKESQSGFNSFFKENCAIANVEYRLTGQATAPAAIEDVRCALIYIIKNAKALNIDVNRIVVLGGSSGGHLALMAGYLANNHIFDNNCKGVEGIKVAAVIDKYGITDVEPFVTGKMKFSKSAGAWIGNKTNDINFIRSVSPINLVTKDCPPTFIAHGDADPLIPYEQSVTLNQKLTDAGVKTQFMTIEGGQHGGFEKEKNSELNKAVINFLREVKVLDPKKGK